MATTRKREELGVQILTEGKAKVKNGHLKNSLQCLANMVRENTRYNDKERLLTEYLAGIETASDEDKFIYDAVMYSTYRSFPKDHELHIIGHLLFKYGIARAKGKDGDAEMDELYRLCLPGEMGI